MTREDHIKDLKKYDHRHENNGFILSIISTVMNAASLNVIYELLLIMRSKNAIIIGYYEELTVMRKKTDLHE